MPQRVAADHDDVDTAASHLIEEERSKSTAAWHAATTRANNKQSKQAKHMSSLSNSNAADIDARVVSFEHDERDAQEERKSISAAMLRMLAFSKVEFVRYVALDVTNNPRCKVVPVRHLQQRQQQLLRRPGDERAGIDYQVSIATVCFAGLMVHADYPVEASGKLERVCSGKDFGFLFVHLLTFGPFHCCLFCFPQDCRPVINYC